MIQKETPIFKGFKPVPMWFGDIRKIEVLKKPV